MDYTVPVSSEGKKKLYFCDKILFLGAVKTQKIKKKIVRFDVQNNNF